MTMRIKMSHGLLLTLLALIFTIGLTFASVELPRLADSLIGRTFDFPNIGTGSGADSEFKTNVYFDYYHLRPIGYGCFAVLIILIVIGFITEKRGLSSAGAIVLFLPAFGHFALTMFFLGGLGFMRLIWLPFLDVSFDVFRLGDIVLLPYTWLLDLASLLHVSIWKELPYVITAIGLLLFMTGTLTWFYSKIHKKGMADFWIYRISRHPQYLGWIIWSYGIMFFEGPNIKKMFDISSSLPWLLMTMVIIGVAMLEELKMRRELGAEYASYCRRTPFLFPVPRFVSWIFSFPQRIMFRKEHPERKREIVTVLGFYTIVCIVLSVFYSGFISLPKDRLSERHIEKLVRIVKESGNRGEKREAAASLAEIGEPAVESLVGLLKDENLYVRWYTANVAGSVKSELVVQPLIDLLHDQDRNVRRAAAASLGSTGARQAVQPLIEAMQNPERNLAVSAAQALGHIGSREAMNPLIEALQSGNKEIAGAAAEALGRIGDREAVAPLIQCLDEQEHCPYNEVGWALRQLGSERSLDAYVAGLKDEDWWRRGASASALGTIQSEECIEPLIGALKDEDEQVRRSVVLALMEIESPQSVEALTEALKDKDFEVRMYAKEALKRIGERAVVEPAKVYND
jgi:HEAT repeat protein/protein-S-isoprenylcysteine O-methyltransferase Ste14